MLQTPEIRETSRAAARSEQRPARQRLPATVRVTQILDAALHVFSDKGFAAARIDDIAAAAGLSKGGIYTHFTSKEEIFAALLTRAMLPRDGAAALPGPDDAVTVDVVLQHVVAPIYAACNDVAMLQTLRLLFSEGARVPHLVQDWRQAVSHPHLAEVEELVRRGVRQGHLRRSALTDHPWMILSPGVYAMLESVTLGVPDRAALAQRADEHAAMLRDMLAP
ncbi:MAG TPA: TetR/AcrR family transcriptional regulator [Pseudorhodoferax sp.]|jgi:AcrR family transcriptional regulator|nr:TetR/AcrR family transcriptional regulator [Pseudorhodoferax sp.]